MGNLRDELVKKGLVSGKRAKQMAHADRARKKKLGKKEAALEHSSGQEAVLTKERTRRAEDQQREAVRQTAADARADRAALIQLVSGHAQRDGVDGPRRFHFITRQKKIPSIDVSEQIARALEQGEMAICELPDSNPERFLLLPAETARRVQVIAPEFVLFFKRS